MIVKNADNDNDEDNNNSNNNNNKNNNNYSHKKEEKGRSIVVQKERQRRRDVDNEVESVRTILHEPSRGLKQQQQQQQLMRRGTEKGEEERGGINILMEIVSAYNIPDGTVQVVVEYEGKEIHQTKKIQSKKPHIFPTWTIETGSLFSLNVYDEESFQQSNGVSFIVLHHKKGSSISMSARGGHKNKNMMIGMVKIEGSVLLEGQGERNSYQIMNKHHHHYDDGNPNKAELVLRFKHGNKEDMEFLHFYHQQTTQNKTTQTAMITTGLCKEWSFLPFQKPKSSFLQRSTKKGSDGKVLYHVKPYADPDRKEETTWMSAQQMNTASFQPSKKWVEAGTGSIGRLYVEVLGCDLDYRKHQLSLNLDTFACLVFEDTIVETDVIHDTRSPRWMPWSQRAFVFHISHPTSPLMIGVFDYDSKSETVLLQPIHCKHDPIGRIVVNLSYLKSKTVYTLQYHLYRENLGSCHHHNHHHHHHHHRKPTGTVTIRLRLEWDHERLPWITTACRYGLQPPTFYVSLSHRIDFKVGHFTTQGMSGDHAFSLDTIAWYMHELKAYPKVIEYIVAAIEPIVMWHGHYDIQLGNITVSLPLHSMVAFTWGIFLIENFDLVPAFVVFSVAWILLATMEHERKHPSPWRKCKSYVELLQECFLGLSDPATIRPNENMDAIHAYNDAMKEMTKTLEELTEQRKTMQQELDDSLAVVKQKAEMPFDHMEGTSENNNTFMDKMNIMKPILFPAQKGLSEIVRSLRIIRSIICWDECFYSFWIVLTCFVVSALMIWVNWSIILRISLRILVWGVLGPWMKLVDLLYYRNIVVPQEEEKKWKTKELLAREKLMKLAKEKRIVQENVKKLQIMTRYMFGKYTISVPRFKDECFVDYPLPSSFAKPYSSDDEDSFSNVSPVRKIMGQNLIGNMIPRTDNSFNHTNTNKNDN